MALRVLLVEDADDVRKLLTLFIGVEGIEVVAVPTGREAIDAASRETFDVLLTDLRLPDIPGEILIREIVASATPRPRVVVISGSDERQVTRATAAGADVVLRKPFDWEQLRDQIVGARPRDDVAA
ncbi:MAG: response regulator [Candidatus Rokubacteria bacterium]|nr:response regulator [Candidatus Rokubacteria bacterium]